MTKNRDRVIAPMHQPIAEWRLQAMRHDAATDRHIERACISIKIWKTLDHFRKRVEIFRITHAAFGPAVGGDYRDPALYQRGSDV